jgi:hypothetical protein
MRVAIVCVSLCAVSIAEATPFARVVRTNPFIEVVDIANNNELTVSNAGFATDSLAMDLAGGLYSADPNGTIFNVTTPFTFPVGPTGFTQIGDLDYASGGLWGFSNANQTLFFFDFSATSVTYSVALPTLSALIVTGVAHRPSDGSIFLSARAGLNNDLLFQVPAASSTANLIGNMPNGDNASYFADIDFGPAGVLYAMTWFHRDFYSVNPLTGATSLISNGPHRDVTGMALSPVPEPASLSALGAALIALTRRRKAFKG